MIDLTKEQVFAEPIKCWVRDFDIDKWHPDWLLGVLKEPYDDYGKRFAVLKYGEHDRVVTVKELLTERTWRAQCILTDPYVKTNP